MDEISIRTSVIKAFNRCRNRDGWVSAAALGNKFKLAGLNFKAFGFNRLLDFLQANSGFLEVRFNNELEPPLPFVRLIHESQESRPAKENVKIESLQNIEPIKYKNIGDLTFDEEQIRALFGSQAAEDEDVERLKEYYYKGSTHLKIAANLPLRILVGHKGVGKSAVFTVLRSESSRFKNFPILIQPDDIAELGKETSNVLQTIRNWKSGLQEIIIFKILDTFDIECDVTYITKMLKSSRNLLQTIISIIDNNYKDTSNSKHQLIADFKSSPSINVFIDDLDRGWQSRKEDIYRISALLNASRDLSNETPGLYFKIALRSDVYYLVRTSDESTDKIEGDVIWHKWTNHEILVMLIKRIETFFGRPFDEKKAFLAEQRHISNFLDNIFERKFQHVGKWENVPMYKVLMSMTRKRPRDLVKLCSLAARDANEQSLKKIGTINLKNVFEEYSQGRMQDTFNEFQSELPQIERLLFSMKPTRKEYEDNLAYSFTTSELKSKINNIIERGPFRFANKKEALADDLLQFMYKINFITAKKELEDGKIDRKYFEENRYLSFNKVSFGYDWEVHPCFRWSLQPDNIQDIFNKIEVNAYDI